MNELLTEIPETYLPQTPSPSESTSFPSSESDNQESDSPKSAEIQPQITLEQVMALVDENNKEEVAKYILEQDWSQEDLADLYHILQEIIKDNPNNLTTENLIQKVTQHTRDLAFLQQKLDIQDNSQTPKEKGFRRLPQKVAAFVTAALLAFLGPIALKNRSASAEEVAKPTTTTSETDTKESSILTLEQKEIAALSLTEIGGGIQTLQQEISSTEEEISTNPDNQELQNQLLSLMEQLRFFLAQAVNNLISSLGAEKIIIISYSEITLEQARKGLEEIIPSSIKGAIAAGDDGSLKRNREQLQKYSKEILSLIFPREKPSPEDWDLSDLSEEWLGTVSQKEFDKFKNYILKPESYFQALSGSLQYEIWTDYSKDWNGSKYQLSSISIYSQEIERLEKMIDEKNFSEINSELIHQLYLSIANLHIQVVSNAENLLSKSNFLPDWGGRNVMEEEIMTFLEEKLDYGRKLDTNRKAGISILEEMVSRCKEWLVEYLAALETANIALQKEPTRYIVPNWDFFSLDDYYRYMTN
jgi:hypothetical protein